MIIIIDILLSVFLFFIIKFIGSLSYSWGYSSLSDIQQEDNSLAYNAIIRIFSPVVFIVIVSIVFYKIQLGFLIENIWFVSLYYSSGIILLMIFLGRWVILDKFKLLGYNLLSITISYFTYTLFIQNGIDILIPDVNSFATEIWFIIILFFYKILDAPTIDQEASEKRLNHYIKTKYSQFNIKYKELLSEYDVSFQNIIYSIMILEDFYRPNHIRFLEKVLHFFGKAKTTGIMQFSSKKLLSDKQSIKEAIKFLFPIYKKIRKKIIADHKEDADWYEYDLVKETTKAYNTGNYEDKIIEIFQIIKL